MSEGMQVRDRKQEKGSKCIQERKYTLKREDMNIEDRSESI